MGVLRDLNDKKQLPLCCADDFKKDPEVREQWNSIIGGLMKDASLKQFGKHIGPFAMFKRDEASNLGPMALAASVPFDEIALLTENAPYLQAKLGVEVGVRLATELVAKEHEQ